MELARYIRTHQLKNALSYIQDPAHFADLGRIDVNGDTPLLQACEASQDEIAVALIYSGQANPGHISNDGTTALIRACQQEMSKTIMALIYSGQSRPNHISSDGDTALLLLCENEMEHEACALVNTGQSLPGYTRVSDGNNALHLAARAGLAHLTYRLLDTGQSLPGSVNQEGHTPLMEACIRGDDKIAYALIESGEADVSQVDHKGHPALMYAIHSHMQPTIDILRSKEHINQVIYSAYPSIVSADGTKQWLNEKALHHRTLDRPAIIRTDGTQEWFFQGERHRVGGPAIVTTTGQSQWYNEGHLVRTVDPSQFRKAKKSAFTYVCMVYMGHGGIKSKPTAHGIPSILKKQTSIQLHIGSFAAPTEACYWPIQHFGEFRRYIESHTPNIQRSVNESKSKPDKHVREQYTQLILRAQKDVVGHVYGEDWMKYTEMTTAYPDQQMNWNKSHHYAEKLYNLKEEKHGQTGWFVMANNIGIHPGAKLLLPTPYVYLTEIIQMLEHASVTHLYMVDVSCATVLNPLTNKPFPDPWINQHLNRTAIQLNRSASTSASRSKTPSKTRSKTPSKTRSKTPSPSLSTRSKKRT